MGPKSGKSLIGNDVEFSGSDTDIDSASDNEIVQNSTRVAKHATVIKRSTKKAQGRKGKSSNRPGVPYKDVLKLLSDVESSGMADAVQWLRDSLSDAVEDLENDPDDVDGGIPLVPILDCSVSAMENEQFLKLLKGFGIKEPADEQEQYWRIPSSLSDNIHKFLNDEIDTSISLDVEVEKSQPGPSKLSSILIDSESEDQNDENGIENGEKSVLKRNKVVGILDSDEEEKEEESVIESQNLEKGISFETKSKRNKVVAILDSDDEENESVKENEDLEGDGRENIHEKMRKMLDSDEEENLSRDEEVSGKRARISDSDTETPIKKKSRVLDSDSDDD